MELRLMRNSRRRNCEDDGESVCVGSTRSKARVDLLGLLPESVIYHVFSFLSTKDVIRTSILSKQWRFFWTKTPVISLDYGDVKNYPLFYCQWVDSVLVSSAALTIDKFHLNLPYSDHMMESVNRWVSFAIVRHVQDLRLSLHPYCGGDGDVDVDVDVDGDDGDGSDGADYGDDDGDDGDGDDEDGQADGGGGGGGDHGDDDDDDDTGEDDEYEYYVLPVVIFSSESAVRLSFRMCDFSALHAADCRLSWSCLKVLRIECAVLRDYMMDAILKGSPVLESIELKYCTVISHVNIYSTRLREVSISGYRDDPCRIDQSTLEISTPNLKSLKLLGEFGRKTIIKLGEASSLVDAELDLDMPEYEGWEDAACVLVERILCKSPGIDRLVLGSCFLKALRILEMKYDSNLPGLNCRDLILRPAFHGETQDVHGIVTILKYSQYVKKIVIDFTPWEGNIKPIRSRRYKSYFDGDPFKILNKREMTCMSKLHQHIDVIGLKLNSISEVISWLPLVKFLLQNGLLPPQTIIHASDEVSRLLEIFQENHLLSHLRGFGNTNLK